MARSSSGRSPRLSNVVLMATLLKDRPGGASRLPTGFRLMGFTSWNHPRKGWGGRGANRLRHYRRPRPVLYRGNRPPFRLFAPPNGTLCPLDPGGPRLGPFPPPLPLVPRRVDGRF